MEASANVTLISWRRESLSFKNTLMTTLVWKSKLFMQCRHFSFSWIILQVRMINWLKCPYFYTYNAYWNSQKLFKGGFTVRSTCEMWHLPIVFKLRFFKTSWKWVTVRLRYSGSSKSCRSIPIYLCCSPEKQCIIYRFSPG